jgi:Ca2+-binding RTX toxin-like protein
MRRTIGKGILKQPFMETIMTVMKTQSAAWAAIAGGTWLGGTPGTDNGDFKDIPGVNKGRGLAGNDHIAGNNNANTIVGDAGDDFLRGGGGGDYLFGGTGNDILACPNLVVRFQS